MRRGPRPETDLIPPQKAPCNISEPPDLSAEAAEMWQRLVPLISETVTLRPEDAEGLRAYCEAAALRQTLADAYEELGQHSKVESNVLRVVEIRTRLLGAAHPDTVAPGGLRRVRDFPADGERLVADRPEGVRHVLVNGTPIRVDGTPDPDAVATRPGRVLRGSGG